MTATPLLDELDRVREIAPLAVPIRALGFDPGPTSCGFCLAEDVNGRPKFIYGGKCPSDDEEIAKAILAAPFAIVAIERPEGYVFQPARGAALIATSNVAGAIRAIARQLGRKVVEVSANDGRRAICGKRGRGVANDAAVKRALSVLVGNMPARSNAHVRDALLVACVALLNPQRAKG